jgi:UTP--glucose-1-phosphate uridylyltransferase
MDRNVKKAVIPAAGLGTRLLPLTEALPKELLPVGRYPMIYWCVVEAALSGIEEVIIIIRKGKEAIRSYLLDDLSDHVTPVNSPEQLDKIRNSIDFTFVYQDQPKGPGDALLEAAHVIKNQPFALMYPDNVFIGETPALRQLLDLYEETGEMTTGLIRVGREEGHLFGNCGRVDLDPITSDENASAGVWSDVYRIRKLYDKGIGTYSVGEVNELRWTGRHLLESSFLDYLRKYDPGKGELDDVGAFQNLLSEECMLGKLIDSEVFDVGNIKGYLRSNDYLAGREGEDYLSLKNL